MLLVQVENPEAAAMYPVDGKMLQDRLCGWRNRWQAGAELNPVWMASLTPHVTTVLPHTTTQEDDKAKVGVMHWFDARVPKPSQWGLQMLEHQDDVIHGKLSKLAEFDRYMGSLGIIPGAMKDLLQDLTRKPDGATDFDAVREMTKSLACKLFTSAFAIWTERVQRDAAWSRLLAKRSRERRERKELKNMDVDPPKAISTTRPSTTSSTALPAWRGLQLNTSRAVGASNLFPRHEDAVLNRSSESKAELEPPAAMGSVFCGAIRQSARIDLRRKANSSSRASGRRRSGKWNPTEWDFAPT